MNPGRGGLWKGVSVNFIGAAMFPVRSVCAKWRNIIANEAPYMFLPN